MYSLCAGLFLLAPLPSFAADFNWTGGVNEFWGEDGNWNAANFPQTGDTATISGAAVDLGGPKTADRLTLASGATLSNTGPGGLTIGNGIAGNVTPIISLSGNGTTISAPVTFGNVSSTEGRLFQVTGTNADTITISGEVNIGSLTQNAARFIYQDGSQSANVIISGNITGAGAFNTLQLHAGNGSITLSGNNTFSNTDHQVQLWHPTETGATSTYYLSHSNALGSTTSSIVFPTGVTGTLAQNRTLQALITDPGIEITSASMSVRQGSISEIGGTNTSGTATWNIDTITLSRNNNADGVSVLPVRLTAASGGTVVFAGQFNSGGPGRSAPVEKIGGGTVILSRTGGVGIDGGLTVKEGTLLITNTNNSGTGSGLVAVESGAVLGGTGRIAPSAVGAGVTIKSGGILLAGTGNSAEESLRISGDLMLESDSIIRLVLGGGFESSSLERQGGTWSFASDQKFDLTTLSGAGAGLYENVITGLAADPGVSAWNVTTTGYGGSTFVYDNGSVHLNVIPEPSTTITFLFGSAALAMVLRASRRKVVWHKSIGNG